MRIMSHFNVTSVSPDAVAAFSFSEQHIMHSADIQSGHVVTFLSVETTTYALKARECVSNAYVSLFCPLFQLFCSCMKTFGGNALNKSTNKSEHLLVEWNKSMSCHLPSGSVILRMLWHGHLTVLLSVGLLRFGPSSRFILIIISPVVLFPASLTDSAGVMSLKGLF